MASNPVPVLTTTALALSWEAISSNNAWSSPRRTSSAGSGQRRCAQVSARGRRNRRTVGSWRGRRAPRPSAHQRGRAWSRAAGRGTRPRVTSQVRPSPKPRYRSGAGQPASIRSARQAGQRRARARLRACKELLLANPPPSHADLHHSEHRKRISTGSARPKTSAHRSHDIRGRIRKITAVALARKQLVALWRYVTTGLVPEGARLKPAAT